MKIRKLNKALRKVTKKAAAEERRTMRAETKQYTKALGMRLHKDE
jgi:hypothetical protein